MRIPFKDRFKSIVEAVVGKGCEFKSYRALTDKAGCHNSNITNYMNGRTKNPDHLVLSRISIALDLPKDYFSQLYLFCEGIIDVEPVDPRPKVLENLGYVKEVGFMAISLAISALIVGEFVFIEEKLCRINNGQLKSFSEGVWVDQKMDISYLVSQTCYLAVKESN